MLVSTVPLCPVLLHRATWEHENNALYRFQIKYFDFFLLVLCPSSPSLFKKKILLMSLVVIATLFCKYCGVYPSLVQACCFTS